VAPGRPCELNGEADALLLLAVHVRADRWLSLRHVHVVCQLELPPAVCTVIVVIPPCFSSEGAGNRRVLYVPCAWLMSLMVTESPPWSSEMG